MQYEAYRPVVVPDDAFRDHLKPKGGIGDISIDPAGRIWFGSDEGELMCSADRGDTWRWVSCPARGSDELGRFEDELNCIRFFDERVGVLAGRIGEERFSNLRVDWSTIFRTIDGGETWSIVKLPRFFLAEDDTLTVTLSGGGVRRGRLELDSPEGPRVDLETLVQPNAPGAPEVDWYDWIFFPSGDEGWIGTQIHHGDARLYHTTDGGRSWTLEEEGELPYVDILRLGDGRWLKLEGLYRWLVWRDGAFEEFAQIPSESRVKIGGAMATAAGGLVANLENGETWFFRSGEEEWTRSW